MTQAKEDISFKEALTQIFSSYDFNDSLSEAAVGWGRLSIIVAENIYHIIVAENISRLSVLTEEVKFRDFEIGLFFSGLLLGNKGSTVYPGWFF